MAMNLSIGLLPLCKKPPFFVTPPLPSSRTFHSFQPVKANYHSTSSPSRRTANFHPTIWADSYLQSLAIEFEDEEHIRKRDLLKDEARHLIFQRKGLIEQLELVDTLKQLGVSYHFEKEINDVLSSLRLSLGSIDILETFDLYETALLFRIQREYGLETLKPSVNDLVKSFKSVKRCCMTNLEPEIKQMLSLYEACFHAREGEDELDEVLEFATNYLSNIKGSISPLNHQLVDIINHALDIPLHWRIPRLQTRWYIDSYERQGNMISSLHELAKLDFNIIQGVYKRELKEQSRWWRNLGIICEELSFSRDRLVESYLWAVGTIYEPKYSECRKVISKLICLLTTIDDIYDVYGTLKELEVFTKAINEWDISTHQSFPEYMKIYLVLFFNTVHDIANTISISKNLDVLPHLKRACADLCSAYLKEARWYHESYTPSLDDYMDNAWISISGHLILTCAYCLSDDLTEESLKNIEFYPNIVRQSCIIFRLYDDLGTSMAEIERGDISKSIQCHMMEANVLEPISRGYIKCLVTKYWKAMNKEYTTNSNFESFKKVAQGLPRMALCAYQHGDGFGLPIIETREQIKSLLIEPIS